MKIPEIKNGNLLSDKEIQERVNKAHAMINFHGTKKEMLKWVNEELEGDMYEISHINHYPDTMEFMIGVRYKTTRPDNIYI